MFTAFVQSLSKTVRLLAAASLVVQAFVVQPAYATRDTDEHHPVTICHRTNSVTNPYVQITVDDDAVDSDGGSDHMNHPGPIFDPGNPPPPPHNGDQWGDIIPSVADDGFDLGHSGLNWTTAGQAILANGCQFPEPEEPEEETGSLKVTKIVEGGDALAEEFGFRLDAGDSFVNPDSGEDFVVFADLEPGTYSVEEDGLDEYEETDSTCEDVEVVANEVATCTITNTFQEGEGGDEGQPHLTIDKSADLDFVNPGSVVTYTVVVKNVGTKQATNAVLSDTLPQYFSYVAGTSKINGSAVADPTINGQTMTWPLGDLDPDESVIVEYQAKVANEAPAGQYTNNAVADSDETDAINDQVRLDLRLPQIPSVGGSVSFAPQPTPEVSGENLFPSGSDMWKYLLAGSLVLYPLLYVLFIRKRKAQA